MIEYIKEYGVTTIEYMYIIDNTPKAIISNMIILEENVRNILDFYKELGVDNIAKLIIARPDLILTNKKNIEEYVEKIGKKLFIQTIKNSPEDLILLGV